MEYIQIIMRIKGQKIRALKAADIFPKTCTSKPLVDLTLLALCISVFSINQLKNDSIGCLICDTALENRSLQALSNFFSLSLCPLTALTGVYIFEFFWFFNALKKSLSAYILSP